MLCCLLSLLATAPAASDPLTLEKATEIALAHANEMIQAREDVLLVDADYATALSAILPRLDLSASAGGAFFRSQILEFRNRQSFVNTPDENPPVVIGRWQDANVNSYVNGAFGLNLTGRQLIFDGGRWWTAISQAETSKKGRAADLRAAQNLVRARVAQTFFALERSRRAIDTLDAQIALDQKQVERAQALLGIGRGLPSDVASARRNLASDQIARVQAETAAGQAERTFNLQLGRAPRAAVALVMPALVQATVARPEAVPPLEHLLTLARQHRPELVSQGANVKTAQDDVTIAAADYWPVLSLQARYNRRSREPGRVIANPFENFTATLDFVVEWNLFEGLATDARVERARIQVRKQQAQLEQLERETLAEVEDARQRWYDQERTFGYALAQIEAAQEALRLAKGLYEAGRGTSLELRTAEVELTRARITAGNARLDAAIARADLERAVGTADWEAELGSGAP